MLIGEFSPSIDAKGRLHFPAKLREDLGERFIVTKGLDNCLCVYSPEGWAELEAKIKGPADEPVPDACSGSSSPVRWRWSRTGRGAS